MKPVQCVDLFCGAGGTGEGVLQAFQEYGVPCKMIGINHWKIAVQTNKFNHKEGHFYCATIDAVDPCEVAGGEPIDFLMASPECTHHSQARGGKPRSNQSRCQPELLINWVRKALVKRMFVENVPEFLSWGPLLVTDTKINNRLYLAGTPDPRKKGVFFADWVRSLQVSGYEVDWRILNAADYGAPTTRVRLIVQAVRRDCGHHIQWPEPTHTMEGTEGKRKWVAAKTIIDWNIKGTSIFERKKPLAVNTLRRIYSGIVKHGGRYADQFGVALRCEIVRSCKFSGRCPFEVLASLPPVAARAEAAPFITVMRGTSPAQDNASIRTTDSPLPLISTHGHEGLVTAFVTRYNGGDDRNHSVSAPVPVVDCSNRYGLVEPFVFATGQTSTGARSTSISAPISTVVTKAEHCIVEPMLLSNHFNNAPVSVSAPCPVVVTSGAVGVINPLIVSLRGTAEGNLDHSAIGVSQTLPTVTAGGTHLAVAEPSVIDMSHLVEESGAWVRSAEEQLPTITTRNNLAVSAPFPVPFFREARNQQSCIHSVKETLPAVTGHGAGGVTEPMFIPQHSGGTVKPVSHPLPTIATTGSISVVSPMLVKFYGNEEEAHSVEKPLGTVTCKDRFVLADGRLVVNEQGQFMRLDILFRMLQPHELAAAMSFPEDYRFAGTKSDQVKQIGNAVCPSLAKALMTAVLPQHFPKLAGMEEGA